MTTQLPFSPLTHNELNARAVEHRDNAGHRVLSIFRMEGGWKPDDLDIAYLSDEAALSEAYHGAAVLRCEGLRTRAALAVSA